MCCGITAIDVHHRNAAADSDIGLWCYHVPFALQQRQALAKSLLVQVQVATL